MIRTVLLTCCVLVLLAVGLYGIVLNGFGLVPTGGDVAGRPAATAGMVSDDDPSKHSPGASDSDAVISPDAARQTGVTPSEPGVAETARAEAGRAETGAATARLARDVTPPNVLSRPTSAYLDPLRRKEAEEEEPDTRLYHRVMVADAGTLQAGKTTIRFAGVTPLDAGRTCTDETGQDWPCGRAAAAALRMLIRHRAVECAVAEEVPEGIVGTCAMGLRNINGWLVEHGWAEAAPQGGYEAAAEIARAEGRGMHRPKWQDKGRGGSGAVPAAAFTAPSIPAER